MQTGIAGKTENREMVTDAQLREFVRQTMETRAKQKKPGEGMRVVAYREANPKRYTHYICPIRTTDMTTGMDVGTPDCEHTYIGQRFRAFLDARNRPHYQPKPRFGRG
jgi:hypothetical protein